MTPKERSRLIDQLDRSFAVMPNWVKCATKHAMGAPKNHPETGRRRTSSAAASTAVLCGVLEIEMIDDEKELPKPGHPLNVLAARLGELLDEDHWAECESLLLKACADAKRLDFLDGNLRMKMGWNVGCAPAGNLSVSSVIQPSGPTSIRTAIDAAMTKPHNARGVGPRGFSRGPTRPTGSAAWRAETDFWRTAWDE